MTWPTLPIPTTNLDSGTADSPAGARADLLAAVQALNDMINYGEPMGGLIGVKLFTAGTHTYNKTAGTRWVIVEAQAAGGGGGSAAAAGAGQAAAGQGGYAGAYAKARITSGFDGASVIVGAAGSGGLGASNGVAGGLSDFGGILICGGGPGGKTWVTPGAGPGIAAIGTALGTAYVSGAATPLVRMSGQIGSFGIVLSSTVAIPGVGGHSPLGTGGCVVLPSSSSTPAAASGYGSGGGGGLTLPGGAEMPGGAGMPGAILVWEYASPPP